MKSIPHGLKAIILSAIAVCCGNAWAATPLAVWESFAGAEGLNGLQYGTSSLKLLANGNEVAPDGSSITINQANGVLVDGFPTGTSAYTVIVTYSNLNLETSQQALISAKNSLGNNRVGVSLLENNGGLCGLTQTDGWRWNESSNKGATLAVAGTFAFVHSSAGGTYVYRPGDTQNAYAAGGLKYGNHNYDGVAIGGLRTATDVGAATGMKIEKVAVYSGTMTQADVTSFVWPSEIDDATVIFDGELPSASDIERFTARTWGGTVWLKNIRKGNGFTENYWEMPLNSYGTVNSKIKLSGVEGFLYTAEVNPTIVLEDIDANTPAWKFSAGGTGTVTTIKKLEGSGTFYNNYGNDQRVKFVDVSGFTGSIHANGKYVELGNGNSNSTRGKIVVDQGVTATIGEGAVWTAENGIEVNGTLGFTGDSTQTAGHKAVFHTGALSGTGTIDLSTTTSDSNHQLREVFKGAAHTFSGNITTKVGTHLVFATANANSTAMSFSNSGFICVEGATSAVLGNGATWTSTGVCLWDNSTFYANGGTLTGRIFIKNGVKVILGSYEKPAFTTTKFEMNAAGDKVNLTLPEGDPTDAETKLIGWNELAKTTAETFNCTPPTGFVLDARNDGLYLVLATDQTTEKTTNVSNFTTLSIVHLGQGGVQKFTGTGGVQIRDLAIRAGGELVVDPVKNPVYVTGGKPVLEAGAKISLAEAYADQTAGVFDLLTWDGSEKITIPEGLVDVQGAALSQVTYTTSGSLDSQARVNKTYTVLKLDLAPTVEKKTITIMPLGDSITEGTNIIGFGNPNYRSFLLSKLAAKGYTVKSTGFRSIKNMNTAGVFMPQDWSWHNGVSGQRLLSSSSRAGWRDALEATLDASEIPDIITFKIGTNDAGTNVDQLYVEWVEVMKRIIKARPATKIVVGSIMNINGSTWQDGWNAKLKDAVEKNLPEFPANQVFFADLNKANPRRDSEGRYLGTFYSEGDLHPNWIGHELNAECWAEAIATALAAPACGTYTPNTKTGAVNNVGDDYRAGFTHLATFTPNNQAITKGTAPAYSYKNTDVAEKPLTKIAYYMELKNTRSGNVRWVWADMDAFGENKTLAGMGVPTDYTFTGDATNLHIDTNDGGIEKIAPTVSGRTAYLQFTQGGLTSNKTQSGAPTGYFTWDWADEVNDGGSYGAMNLYLRNPTYVEGGVAGNHYAAQTLLAFSRYATADQQIGIGNCAIHGAPIVYGNIASPVNYMETYQFERLDLASYTVASIEIWAKPEQVGPTSWADVTEETNVKDVVDQSTQAAIREANSNSELTAEEIADWALALAEKGVTVNIRGTIPVKALILNCAPDAIEDTEPTVVVDEATMEAIMTAVETQNDPTKVEIPKSIKSKYPMAKIEVIEATELTSTETAKFFKLKLTLK